MTVTKCTEAHHLGPFSILDVSPPAVYCDACGYAVTEMTLKIVDLSKMKISNNTPASQGGSCVLPPSALVGMLMSDRPFGDVVYENPTISPEEAKEAEEFFSALSSNKGDPQ